MSAGRAGKVVVVAVAVVTVVMVGEVVVGLVVVGVDDVAVPVGVEAAAGRCCVLVVEGPSLVVTGPVDAIGEAVVVGIVARTGAGLGQIPVTVVVVVGSAGSFVGPAAEVVAVVDGLVDFVSVAHQTTLAVIVVGLEVDMKSVALLALVLARWL